MENFISGSNVELITVLHHIIYDDKNILSLIDKKFINIKKELDSQTDQCKYSSGNIDIELFKKYLPINMKNKVNLCRLFVLKKNCKMKQFECHKNSIQRLMSYKNSGSINSIDSLNLQSDIKVNHLKTFTDIPKPDILECWNIIQENNWHYPKATDMGDWYTVTFHSAAESEIIDVLCGLTD